MLCSHCWPLCSNTCTLYMYIVHACVQYIQYIQYIQYVHVHVHVQMYMCTTALMVLVSQTHVVTWPVCIYMYTCVYVSSPDTDSGYASLPPTSLSQDSYDFLPPSRPTLETSVSMDPATSSSLAAAAEGRDDSDGSAMSRSLDRRIL